MCFKLVIKTNLYYDARSEERQTVFAVSHFCLFQTLDNGQRRMCN
jgi:hypothetical protein